MLPKDYLNRMKSNSPKQYPSHSQNQDYLKRLEDPYNNEDTSAWAEQEKREFGEYHHHDITTGGRVIN